MKNLLLCLLLLSIGQLAHAKPDPGVHDAFSEYWTVLRVSLDGFFVPENKLLRLRFFEERTPTSEEIARKKTEVVTLAELVVSDLASLDEKPAAKRVEELNATLGFFCELSFWAVAGADAEQQFKLNRSFSRLWAAANKERTRISQMR